MTPGQGDQIGRIFAQRVTDHFGYFLCKIKETTQIIGIHALYGNGYVLIFAKNGLDYILADFFTCASGHPAPSLQGNYFKWYD
jgi:hypothetical protein